MSCSRGPTSYELSKFGKEKEVLFITSETEKLRRLISCLPLMGVEVVCWAMAMASVPLRKNSSAAFRKPYKHLKKGYMNMPETQL